MSFTSARTNFHASNDIEIIKKQPPSASELEMVLTAVVRQCQKVLEKPLSTNDPLNEVPSTVLQAMKEHPDIAVNHARDKLHAFSYQAVPDRWRRAYEEAALWAVVKAHAHTWQLDSVRSMPSGKRIEHCLSEIIGRLDAILIMVGAPKHSALIHSMLDMLKPREQNEPRKPVGENQSRSKRHQFAAARVDAMSMKIHGFTSNYDRWASIGFLSTNFPTEFPQSGAEAPQLQRPTIRLDHPSLSQFQDHWHRYNCPTVLTNTLSHWEAQNFWDDPNFWMDVTLGGRRLVPVELGANYLADGWTQKIMKFGEFMVHHLLADLHRGDTAASNQPSAKGYLAQHALLTQIPALRSHIAVPDYCYAEPPASTSLFTALPGSSAVVKALMELQDKWSKADGTRQNAAPTPNSTRPSTSASSDAKPVVPTINIWLGPADTISPAHTDPHHNILAQVFGRKYVRLYAPNQTPRMYPMGSNMDWSTPRATTAAATGKPWHGAHESGATASGSRIEDQATSMAQAIKETFRQNDQSKIDPIVRNTHQTIPSVKATAKSGSQALANGTNRVEKVQSAPSMLKRKVAAKPSLQKGDSVMQQRKKRKTNSGRSVAQDKARESTQSPRMSEQALKRCKISEQSLADGETVLNSIEKDDPSKSKITSKVPKKVTWRRPIELPKIPSSGRYYKFDPELFARTEAAKAAAARATTSHGETSSGPRMSAKELHGRPSTSASVSFSKPPSSSEPLVSVKQAHSRSIASNEMPFQEHNASSTHLTSRPTTLPKQPTSRPITLPNQPTSRPATLPNQPTSRPIILPQELPKRPTNIPLLPKVITSSSTAQHRPSSTIAQSSDSHHNIKMDNTSRVDVGLSVPFDMRTMASSKHWTVQEHNQRLEMEREQNKKFPLFQGANFVECVLEPGECLFIPRGWWHYCRSLDASCSVSFWWD